MMTPKIRWTVTAAGVVILAFAASFYLPFPDAKPSEAAFVGRWQLESSSLPSVLARTGQKPTNSHLILGPDGRFTAESFPVEDPFTKPDFRLMSGEGRWELSRQQVWVLDLIFPGGRSWSLEIRNENGGPVALWNDVYADPDERWTWRKVP
jgi:hypothetical protein